MLHIHPKPRSRKKASGIVLCALVGALAMLAQFGARAAQTPTTQLMVAQCPGNSRDQGDFVSPSDSLNKSQVFFVEVPPNTPNLHIELFDADINAGSPETYDISNAGTGACTYVVKDPTGAQKTSLSFNNTQTTNNNAWKNLYTVASPVKGHWRVFVDTTGTSTAINAYGIRAYYTSGSNIGLNIYTPTYYVAGTARNAIGTSTSYSVYPWITSGCSIYSRNFDWDTDYSSGRSIDGGNIQLQSRKSLAGSGGVNTTIGGSAASPTSFNNTWFTDAVALSTSGNTSPNTTEADYGIWKETLTLKNFTPPTGTAVNLNYGTVCVGNYQYKLDGASGSQSPGSNATSPPSGPPYSLPVTGDPSNTQVIDASSGGAYEANTFRIYLPQEDGSAPVKPYVSQTLTWVSGNNPPKVNQTSTYQVTLTVTNPTAYAITFDAAASSGTNIVQTWVPAGKASYVSGSASGAGSAGNIDTSTVTTAGQLIKWAPGSVAANSRAQLTYQVSVSPTTGNDVIAVTGSPGGTPDGATATYLDETGDSTSTDQRAYYTFGPLCPLSVQANLSSVTLAKLDSFDAATYPGNGVHLKWRTSYEVDNLGFNVYRDDSGLRTRLNPSLIQGSALAFGHGTPNPEGDTYEWWDNDTAAARYWLEDVDLSGRSTWRGPFSPHAGAACCLPRTRPPGLRLLGETEPGDTGTIFAGQQPRAAASAREAQTARKQTANLPLPALPAVKIGVTAEGWYKVTQAQLAQTGLPKTTNSSNLHLYVDGQEIPFAVVSARSGKFAPGDSIQFYGLGVDTQYTGTHTYWLTSTVAGGQRLALQPPTTASKPAASSFPYTVERKERTQYYSALHNGNGNKFFGSAVTATPNTQPLTLTRLTPGSAGTLELALQGVTQVAGSNPRHDVQVNVNGTLVGQVVFVGTEHPVQRFNLPAGLLVEGLNQVELTAEGDAPDVSVIDYVRITYQHAFSAEGNRLRFTAAGGQSVTVDDFTSKNLHLLDVTNPNAPMLLPVTAAASGAGFALSGVAPGSGERTLLAFADEAAAAPASLTPNSPSNLKAATNQADLLIVTPGAFKSSLGPLVTARTSRGLKVLVADIEDVYDEFNFGQKDVSALQAFLRYAAATWQTKPRWVLLAGDATFDPRNYLGSGKVDYVPTALVETNFAQTASDDELVDFDNTALPSLAIGRLPAASASDAATMVQKITAYPAQGSGGPASGTGLFASDVDPALDFAGANALVAEALPKQIQAQQLSRATLGDSAWRNALIAGWNAGPSIINFQGHGSVEVWTSQGLFGTADANALTNKAKLPVVASMTCLNGYFVSIRQTCLAESLLANPNGGAVAVWASSTLTQPSLQIGMNRTFFQAALGSGSTLGEAAAAAKAESSDPDVRRTWILFGDPSMRIR